MPAFHNPRFNPGRRRIAAALGLLCAPAAAQLNLVDSEGRPVGAMEAPFITTPENIIPIMLDLAAVTASDIVYDLGCGDGRIVIAAGRRGEIGRASCRERV